MGVCILSLAFYSPSELVSHTGMRHSRPHGFDIHALMPSLQHLVALERTELLSRCVCVYVCVCVRM